MEVAITKISENGQVVIPAEVRRDAGIKPFTKFLVFNEGGNILLKVLNPQELVEEMQLFQKIERSEKQIKERKCVVVDSTMDDEEIDDLLMG